MHLVIRSPATRCLHSHAWVYVVWLEVSVLVARRLVVLVDDMCLDTWAAFFAGARCLVCEMCPIDGHLS